MKGSKETFCIEQFTCKGLKGAIVFLPRTGNWLSQN